jgi:hypothetical protein
MSQGDVKLVSVEARSAKFYCTTPKESEQAPCFSHSTTGWNKLNARLKVGTFIRLVVMRTTEFAITNSFRHKLSLPCTPAAASQS